MTARYRAVLMCPGATRLLASTVAGRMPLGMFPLAILLLINQQTRSLAIAGAAVGAAALVSAVTTPTKGWLLGTVGIRKVIVGCAGLQAVVMVSLVLVVRIRAAVPIVALAGLSGAFVPPTSACARGLWPRVAADRVTLDTAYALDATTQEVIWTTGPLLVAAAAAALSPTVAVLLTAAIGLVGNVWFATSRLCAGCRNLDQTAATSTSPLASGAMRALLITVVLTGLTAGALEVGLPALAIHLGTPGLGGVLLALWSLGSMLGGLAYGAGSWAVPLEVRYLGLLLAVAVMTSLLAFATTAAAACALSFVAGVGQAPVLASQFSLVNELSPPGGATSAFAWNTSALVIGVAAGSAVAGAIVRPAGFSLPFLVGAASALVAAAGSLTVRSATTGRHAVIVGSARRFGSTRRSDR